MASIYGPLYVVAASPKGGKTWGYNVQLPDGRYTTVSIGSDYRAAQRTRRDTIAFQKAFLAQIKEMEG